MTRRLRRNRDFELSLTISNPDFLKPPRDSQRNWLLNRLLKESEQNLFRLHESAANFVPGIGEFISDDRSQADLTDDSIMEDWQLPLMKAMSEFMPSGDVLEVGFGRGVSAGLLQARGLKSHTIVECNDGVVERMREWEKSFPDSTIDIVHGRWENVGEQLDSYDGIFFHTYALSQEEFFERTVSATTFADNFFQSAGELLRPGGVLTYLTNEIDSIGREHQRLLLENFREFRVSKVQLKLPEDVRDAWWADSMMVIGATK